MKWDPKRETYTLRSGRELEVSYGIIGLGLNGEIYEGYDGHLGDHPCFSADEREDIAIHMIIEWAKWGFKGGKYD